MSRGVWVIRVWVIRDGELIERHLAPPLHPRFAEGPMVISDSMEYTLNPADGKRYGSKRAYEKAVRAAGCEIVGNENLKPAPRPEMPDPAQDIIQAIETIEARSSKAKRKGRKPRGI